MYVCVFVCVLVSSYIWCNFKQCYIYITQYFFIGYVCVYIFFSFFFFEGITAHGVVGRYSV